MKMTFLDSINILDLSMKDIAWIIGGNFKIITTLQDKKGGVHKLELESEAFTETISRLQ
jgi:hypothetical protein